MKILIIGKDKCSTNGKSQGHEVDTCNIVSSIKDVFRVLENKENDALVLIVDNKTSTFYSLLARLNKFSQPVQLLLLNPSNRYYLVAENDRQIAVSYHLPQKSGS